LGKFNILISVIGIIYLVYSFLFRKTVTVYHKSYKKFIIDNEKYLKLQLNFSIANSMIMIIVGLIATILNLSYTYAFLSVILFHAINFLFILVAKRKGYIQYN
jgi:hypothetical protein